MKLYAVTVWNKDRNVIVEIDRGQPIQVSASGPEVAAAKVRDIVPDRNKDLVGGYQVREIGDWFPE